MGRATVDDFKKIAKWPSDKHQEEERLRLENSLSEAREYLRTQGFEVDESISLTKTLERVQFVSCEKLADDADAAPAEAQEPANNAAPAADQERPNDAAVVDDGTFTSAVTSDSEITRSVSEMNRQPSLD